MTFLLNPYRYATPTPPAGVTLVQHAAGGTGASTQAPPVTATLPGASTGGNALLLAVASDATVSTPAGWALVDSEVDQNGLYLFSKTSAGETTVNFTPGATVASSWWIAEYSGLNVGAALASASTHISSGSPTSGSTGTTGATSGATAGLAVAVWGSTILGGASRTGSGETNAFVELDDTCTTTAGNNLSLVVATLTPIGDGTFESTVTLSGSALSIGGIVAVFAAV